MSNVQPITLANKPGAFKPAAIEDFVALVLAGGEVSAHGLKERVLRAECIAFLRKDRCLLGVAGLKQPSQNHRAKISAGAGVSLTVKKFPLELGWVFVLPGARGCKLSLPLCASLIGVAGGRGIFATSRVTNIGIHKTLTKLSFTCIGTEWPSQQNSDNLALFIRNVP